MLSSLSIHLVNLLYDSCLIKECDKELYVYGLFILLSNVFYFLLSFLFGILLECALESMLFYILFLAIRRYAGGIHANSEACCMSLTTIAIFFSVLIIRLQHFSSRKIVWLLLFLLCSSIVFLFSPVGTKEKPISIDERNYYRKTTRIIVVFYISICLIAYIVPIWNVFYSVNISMILEAILLVFSKILDFRKRILNKIVS